MNVKYLKNWVIYYCYVEDYIGIDSVPLRVHGVELPNSATYDLQKAVAIWQMEYRPANNGLQRLATERCPDDWDTGGGKPANIYYMERVAALTSMRLPKGTPEVGFELYRAEHTGHEAYDGYAVMRAIRAACKGQTLS